MAAMAKALKRFDRATGIAFGCIILLLAVGALYEPNFLSLNYLLQQLQIASFLGIMASGMMLVILLGHIDLSIPWTVSIGGIMATGAVGLFGESLGDPLAIPFGVACGVVVGIINGVGVAYLRAPSMIFTLGTNAVAQGLMLIRTGGFAPKDYSTKFMHELAVDRWILGIPNPVFVWIGVGAVTVFILTRTVLGRRIYAIGNREKAVFLSGVDTKRVLLICFAISGGCAALGGALLSGYANRSYQAMGVPYLLPTIAAIVLGGTNVLGGKGTYLGTIAGVILITLLQSILSVLQPQEFLAAIGVKMPAEAIRQGVFGLVIVGMLLLYGRERLVR